jgi:hypothetical protein
MTEKQKPAPVPDWMLNMARNEPPGFMQGVYRDARHGISASASMIPPHMRKDETPRATSGATVELKSPAGIKYVDMVAESFARIDKADAIRRQIEAELILKSQSK